MTVFRTVLAATASAGYIGNSESARRACQGWVEQTPLQFAPPRYRVSLIVPAYNEEKYIGNLLQSALNQVEPFHEIIVADCSDPGDATGAIAQSLGARVIRVPYGNLSQSKNLGAIAAQGEVLAFADADMILANEYVLQAVDSLESGRALVTPRTLYYDSALFNLLFQPLQMLRFGTMGANSCQVLSREVFDSVGGFSPQCNAIQGEFCAEGLDLAQRVAMYYGKGAIAVLPFIAGTSARRFKRFGLGTANREQFSVAVRSYQEVEGSDD